MTTAVLFAIFASFLWGVTNHIEKFMITGIETAFMKPYTTIDEINQEWQHIKDENIQNIEINLLAIEGNVIIAQWILKQNNKHYDGIYEIKFNELNECIYFKSWEMEKDNE